MAVIITDFPDVNKSHMISTTWGENCNFLMEKFDNVTESFDVPAGCFCAVVCQKYNLYGLVTSIFVAKYMSQHKRDNNNDNLFICLWQLIFLFGIFTLFLILMFYCENSILSVIVAFPNSISNDHHIENILELRF